MQPTLIHPREAAAAKGCRLPDVHRAVRRRYIHADVSSGIRMIVVDDDYHTWIARHGRGWNRIDPE